MTTIHKILKSMAERARNLSVDTVYEEGYRKGYHHALDEVSVEIDKAVVSTHDPIAGAIGSVEYDRMRIITESGFLVANVRVFDLVQNSEGIFQDDFGQWIADAINEKIGGTYPSDEWILKRANEILRRSVVRELTDDGLIVDDE